MHEELDERIDGYLRASGGKLIEQIGFGIHGSVFLVENNRNPFPVAVKFLLEEAPFERECRVYARLGEARVTELMGFQIPRLLARHDQWLAIEMTVVHRPFILDFAGAYLDWPPQFSPEVWAEWEAERRDQFGARWSLVQAVLNELRDEFGIYVLDIHPSNIAFPPDPT